MPSDDSDPTEQRTGEATSESGDKRHDETDTTERRRPGADSGESAHGHEDDERLVLVDEHGEEWVLPDEVEDSVVLDDTGQRWALLDEHGEHLATFDPEATNDGGRLSRSRARTLVAGGVVVTSLVGVSDLFDDETEVQGADISAALADVEFDYPTALALPFAHGVASGDPLSSRVVLWTRLTYENPPDRVAVDYEVGTDPGFSRVVTEGTVRTGPGRDWTVKADATGLEPGTTYYYRFHTDEATSIVGRTRTAPAGDVSELRFGVVGCSSYWSGWFNAYGRLADRNSLDLVVHTGDHIYPEVDRSNEWRRARHDIFDKEYVDFRKWETLDELRRRYALHYSDPDYLRARQQHPFSIIWDDGELKADEEFEVTEADARRAFWEWTPTRPPKPDGSGEPIEPTDGYLEPEDDRYLYRKLPYGELADLLLMDQQQWRTESPSSAEEMFDERATLLGREQFEWLVESMVDSAESGTPWRLLGNQKFITPFRAANLPESVPLFDRDEIQEELTYNPDQWDGYPAERERLCNRLREHGVDDNVFFTGDMHFNWCADVTDQPTGSGYDGSTGRGENGSVGVSFAPTSVSRGGAYETIEPVIQGLLDDDITHRVTVGVTRFASAEIDATHPHVQYTEWIEHGYGIAHVTEQEVTLEYWWTPLTPRTPQQELGVQLRVPRSDEQLTNHAVHVSDPQPTAGSRTAPPAPFPEGLEGY